MIKVVFMGTPDFAVPSLLKLIDDKTTEVSLVITQEDKRRNRNKLTPTPVKKVALDHKLKVITPADVNHKEVIDQIKEIGPDFIVVIAYGQIIKEELLSAFQDKIINVHASLLPKYRGASPINTAIIKGDKESGITIMLVEKGLDCGDMLCKKKIEIDDDEHASSLHDRLMILGSEMLIDVIHHYKDYYKNREKQLDEHSSYAQMLRKEMGKISFDQPIQVIYDKFRGLDPWPGSYLEYEGKKIKVHQLKKSEQTDHSEPGTVLKVDDSGIYVMAKDGVIVIEEIQFPGKKRMKVSEYLKGNQWNKNIRLSE